MNNLDMQLGMLLGRVSQSVDGQKQYLDSTKKMIGSLEDTGLATSGLREGFKITKASASSAADGLNEFSAALSDSIAVLQSAGRYNPVTGVLQTPEGGISIRPELVDAELSSRGI